MTQACVGHICLGVPLDTEQYVRDAALAIIRSHAPRLRAVIHLEVGGALGDESEDFLREAAKVAEHCRRGVGDLTHWSAMTWGGHWRQRIGVEIARGLARCIERAATGGRVEGSSARSRSQEWDPSCC